MNRGVKNQPPIDRQPVNYDQHIPRPLHTNSSSQVPPELSLLASLSTLSLEQEASLSQGILQHISRILIFTSFLFLSSSDRVIGCSTISNIRRTRSIYNVCIRK